MEYSSGLGKGESGVGAGLARRDAGSVIGDHFTLSLHHFIILSERQGSRT